MSLNHDFEDIEQPGIWFHNSHFKLGDKVVFTKNNYDAGYCNGDIGFVETIEAIDYQVALTDDLDAILKAQNEGGRQTGPSVDNSHQAALVPSYSQEKLDQAIEALSVLNSSAVTVTKDASISPYEEGKPFSIVPAVQGNDVDREKTILAVNEAVKAGRNELDLEAEGCYRTVSLWESDEHLKDLCDAMNSRREKKLRYVFGEAEEFLTGETMASWITGVSEGKITVDQEKAAAFVKDLASRYDTAGTARTVTKAAGGQAEITGDRKSVV